MRTWTQPPDFSLLRLNGSRALTPGVAAFGVQGLARAIGTQPTPARLLVVGALLALASPNSCSLKRRNPGDGSTSHSCSYHATSLKGFEPYRPAQYCMPFADCSFSRHGRTCFCLQRSLVLAGKAFLRAALFLGSRTASPRSPKFYIVIKLACSCVTFHFFQLLF